MNRPAAARTLAAVGRWAAALTLAGAFACGGDYCSRLHAAEQRYFVGSTRCEYVNGTTTSTVLPMWTPSCSSALRNCTADDLHTLEAFVSCRETTPVCAPGAELDATGAAVHCASQLSLPNGAGLALSHGCASTLFSQ
jgi:hypothetical protein